MDMGQEGRGLVMGSWGWRMVALFADKARLLNTVNYSTKCKQLPSFYLLLCFDILLILLFTTGAIATMCMLMHHLTFMSPSWRYSWYVREKAGINYV